MRQDIIPILQNIEQSLSNTDTYIFIDNDKYGRTVSFTVRLHDIYVTSVITYTPLIKEVHLQVYIYSCNPLHESIMRDLSSRHSDSNLKDITIWRECTYSISSTPYEISFRIIDDIKDIIKWKNK